MEIRHRNQLSIYDPEIDGQKKILIVWAGGIGSSTAYALAQMGIQDITVIDFDDVENHNVATQFYQESQLGKQKLVALQENVKAFTWVEIKIIEWLFEAKHVDWMDIVIMGVDNMKTRKEIADACETSSVERLIDCRMKAEFFMIYNFIPQYELSIYMTKRYSDDDADPEKCTEKGVSYNCLGIASVLARMVKGIIKKEKYILDKFETRVDLHNLQIT